MSEECTTADVVELTRRQFEAVNRGDPDALMTVAERLALAELGLAE